MIIGDTAAAHSVVEALRGSEITAAHLNAPTDIALAAALTGETDWVAIMVHDDILALRYALACAHLSPEISILVTIFDRTIGDEVQRLLVNCEVTSPADLALPQLTRMCLEGTAHHGATLETDQRPTRLVRALRSLPRTAGTHLTGFLRTTETGARIMILGLLGLALIVLLDFWWLVSAEHRSPTAALHEAVRVVTTVGPAGTPHDTSYALLSAASMLITVILTAMFTAGVVDRSIGPRLLGLLGPRSIPHSGHVIVVGLGQVGARLCIALRQLGVPVLAVERDPAAPGLRLIHHLRIPTIVGHGIDRSLLERARLSKAVAIAAVGSGEIDNLAVAVAAHGIAADIRIVMRAGEQDTAANTQALLPLGAVCDVTSLTTRYVLSRIALPCHPAVATHPPHTSAVANRQQPG